MSVVNIHQVLADLEMLSHGTTQAFNPAGGVGAETFGFPPGGSQPPHLYWRAKLDEAGGDELAIAKVLKGAQSELDAWRGGIRPQPRGETQAELHTRIVKDGEGWSVQEVAVSIRVSTTIVRKARLAAGRNIDNGKPILVTLERIEDLVGDEMRQRAQEYAANGYSERQIRMLTGLPKTTVRRILGRAA